MWYKVDPEGLKRDEVLTLYRILDQRERAFREDLFRFTNFYAAVCYAILAITMSGFLALYQRGPLVMCLVFGPILTLCMCLLGIRVTTRIYRRIIEEISIKAKLENILGLDHPLAIAQYLGKEPMWKDDECILPPRHAERRRKNDTCAEFIATASRSSFYRDNRLYFGLIGIFSIGLSIAILVVGIVAMFK